MRPRTGPIRLTAIVAAGAMCVMMAGCRAKGPARSPALETRLADSAAVLPPKTPREVRRAIVQFYQQRGMVLAWPVDRNPRSVEWAFAALGAAAAHGLDPERYRLSTLRTLRDSLAKKENTTQDRDRQLADFDIQVTASLLSLGRDVATGHARVGGVNPRSRRALPPLAAALERAREGSGPGWPDAVQPPHPEYAALRHALATLEAQHARGGWPEVPGTVVQRHPPAAAVTALDRRLIAGGELAESEGGRITPAARERAVRSFQDHHGLKATGRVDRATRDALNVPIAERVRQVRINLERWRWMPDDLGASSIRVNIPQFYLQVIQRGRTTLGIRAIVGKRGDETPVLTAGMTYLVFSPYWNIPETIVNEETLPALWQDPTFLERNDIEIVRRDGAATEVVDPESIDWGDEAELGALAFRQRPGARNALGFVKFMFPNPYSVYIHDTPGDQLFSRIGRAFSHGCVRIEDPLALAAYLLRDRPEWTRASIQDAMQAGTERVVKLTHEVPVHLMYFTAWVDEHGGLHFGNDVYGYDGSSASHLT